MPKAMIVYANISDSEYYDKYIAVAATDCAEISEKDVHVLRAHLHMIDCPYELTPTLVVFPDGSPKDFLETSLKVIKDKLMEVEKARIQAAEKRKAAAEKRKLEKAKKLAEKNKLSEEQELKLLEELKKKYQ